MARPKEEAKPFKSDGYWHLLRRVPKSFSDVEKRRFVTISTKIAIVDDPKGVVARTVVRKLDDNLFAYWRDRKAGKITGTSISYESALRITGEAGLPYIPYGEILADPQVLISRLKALKESDILTRRSVPEALAFMGAAEKGNIRLSEMVDVFKELNVANVSARSERQQHRWEVNRNTAVQTFIAVLGSDKKMNELTFEDVMAVNKHQQARIAANEIVHDTANKCISRVAALFRDINRQKRLGLDDCFRDTRISGGRTRRRPPFPIKHVQDSIMKPGMFDGLNDEARDIIYFVAETGVRPSEAVYLLEDNIHLQAENPHFEILPDKRVLKTNSSARTVPLVGVGLEVMRRNPKGFVHYREKGAEALEAVVSKALRSRGLILQKGQCLYSLRHTFEDRLQRAKVQEKVITFLMGHKWHREVYGQVTLDEKAEAMKLIAFESPYRL